jgi:hypothetical protein
VIAQLEVASALRDAMRGRPRACPRAGATRVFVGEFDKREAIPILMPGPAAGLSADFLSSPGPITNQVAIGLRPTPMDETG